jgi:glycosyltransferase involved in cell wall biosynthesis
MLQIAFITVGDSTRRTGGYLYHHEVHTRLRRRGHRVTEIVAGAVEPAAQRAAARSLGAQVDPAAYDVIVVDALARIVCAPWLAAWQALRPLAAMIHELPSAAGEHTNPADSVAEAALLCADRLITVSNHGAATLIARGVAPERITIASGGFDRLAEWKSATGTGGSRTAPQPHPHTALCVAQWIPRKQILELVHAWNLAAPEQWQLELIGETTADEAYAEAVRSAIARSVAPVAVRGAVDDATLAEAYANAAFFVLPSRFEGYGIVYAEALAYGLPVIACTGGPVPELLGPAGVLVPPDDQPALVTALRRLTADAELRARLSAAAWARAAALPTWDDTTDHYLAALETARQRIG